MSDTLYGVQVLFQNERLYAQAGWDTIEGMRAHIDQAAQLGVEAIRFPGDWRALQPDGPDTFNQDYVDAVIATLSYARSLGISVVMTFAQTPYWATPGTDHPDSQAAIWHPPVGAAAEAFAAAIVYLHDEIAAAGLVDMVEGWEIWNEPNTTTFWPGGELREGTDVQVDLAAVADYVALLNTAYTALHAADPDIVVLGGSLAGCDTDYLAAMYAAGALFDGLALHPYTKANPFNDGIAYSPTEFDPRDVLSSVWSFEEGISNIRELMAQQGDSATQLWFTEFGWSSANDWGGAGSPAAQAAFLAMALEMISGWDFVAAAFAYRLFDEGGEQFGMFREDGSIKPAGVAIEAFLDAHGEGPSSTLANQAAPPATVLDLGGDTGATRTDLAVLNAPAGADQIRNILGSAHADVELGDGRANTLFGFGGDDVLMGRGGNDRLLGGAGDNRISGGTGNDTLIGGSGRDWMEGGSGADAVFGGRGANVASYATSSAGVAVNLATGAASGGHASGDRLVEITGLDGSAYADTLIGSAVANVLNGLAGADRLEGGSGRDTLSGGDGDDSLVGGRGGDVLGGGAGRDTFVFLSMLETAAGTSARDVIEDFQAGSDRIDLAAIDAVTTATGNQSFRWIGTSAFQGTAGELHVSSASGGAVLSGDVNGDRVADFEIFVRGVTSLAAGDIVL